MASRLDLVAPRRTGRLQHHHYPLSLHPRVASYDIEYPRRRCEAPEIGKGAAPEWLTLFCWERTQLAPTQVDSGRQGVVILSKPSRRQQKRPNNENLD